MNWLDAIKGGTPDDLFAVEVGRWLNKRMLGPYDQAEAQRIAGELGGKLVRLTMHVDTDDDEHERPAVFGAGLGRGGPFG